MGLRLVQFYRLRTEIDRDSRIRRIVLSDSDCKPSLHFYSHQPSHFGVCWIYHDDQPCPVVAEDGLLTVGADGARAYHPAGLTRLIGQVSSPPLLA